MTSVTENDILQALHQVPAHHWPDVLGFVTSLRPGSEEGESAAPIRTAADLIQSDVVGMWADRTDITDSRTFARQLRERAQHRRTADAS